MVTMYRLFSISYSRSGKIHNKILRLYVFLSLPLVVDEPETVGGINHSEHAYHRVECKVHSPQVFFFFTVMVNTWIFQLLVVNLS